MIRIAVIRNSFLLLTASVACLIGFSGTLRADVTLVDNGTIKCVIYAADSLMAPDDKTPGVKPWQETENEKQRRRLRESVNDLALYLEKMSGARPEIVIGEPPRDSKLIPIYVGQRAEKVFGPPRSKFDYKQGYRVVISPHGVGLTGESDLATSYAVYELLDRLGCRWYMPGELGEVVPAMKTIRLKECDDSQTPGTIYRGVWYADDVYNRRNRLGGLLLNAGHALEGYLTKEDREKHPEWRAIVNGKPSPNRLRWSNPAVADAIADKLIDTLDKSYRPSLSLSPDDGMDFDESAEDRAIDAGDFDTTFQMTSITDRYLVLCNRIAAKVTKKHPDVLFGMLAYVNYTRPPLREKPHPSIIPQIAPITYSRSHPMTDDAVPGNPDLRNLVTGWGKVAPRTSMYYYGWFLAEPAAPNPMIAKWSVDVPMALANHCQFWQPETMPNFETSMHGLYLGIRLAWNPKLDPAQVINELNTRFYGHAAREMTAYWKHIDDVWVKTPDYSGCGFGYLRRWTPEQLEKARELMDTAVAACQTTTEVQRVRLADESLELFELFMKLRRDQAAGRFAQLAGDGELWLKQVGYLGEKYRENFTFTRTPYAPQTVNASYARQFYQLTYNDATRLAKETVILTPQPLCEFRYQADKDATGEAQGFAKVDYDDQAWKTTDVTRETWSALGYHDWFKSMWYRTQVKLPAAPKGKKVYLWIGSTDGSAKVFINGEHIPYVSDNSATSDASSGYCQPASWDITDKVSAKGDTKIAILCTRTFFNELGTGGLLSPVVIYREK